MITRCKWIVCFLTLVTITSGCTQESAEDRRKRDESIGLMENDAYRFSADGGLLHITQSSDSSLHLRASAAEFSARFVRKRSDLSSIQIQISNMPNSPSLRINGIDTAGTAIVNQPHTWSWTVSFATDEATLVAPPLAQQNFRFLAFGDIQEALGDFGKMVDAVNQETTAEFVLMLGDLTSRSKADEFAQVEAHYSRIQFPVYTTPGNHDVMRPREYQNRFGRANYSFTHRGARFSSIDSSAAELDPNAWDWAKSWMSLGAGTQHIFFSHIPAVEYSGIRSGQWNSRREANKFLALAKSNAVDLLLFGHVHSHYSYKLAGIPTHISGGCGAIEEKMDGIDRHYLRIDVDTSTSAIKVEVVRIE